MKGVRITTVDKYQGEECDVILLSLVRSNDECNVGYLKTENRVGVALSRARHGEWVRVTVLHSIRGGNHSMTARTSYYASNNSIITKFSTQ